MIPPPRRPTKYLKGFITRTGQRSQAVKAEVQIYGQVMFLIYLTVFQAGALIRQARRDLEANGFDLTTGLLLPDGVTCAAQNCSSLSGTDSKPSHIPTPQLQQPSPQSLQSGVPQQQNLQASQQQHRQQPEEGLAGEIDRELATILDKSRLVVCLQTFFVMNYAVNNISGMYFFIYMFHLFQ